MTLPSLRQLNVRRMATQDKQRVQDRLQQGWPCSVPAFTSEELTLLARVAEVHELDAAAIARAARRDDVPLRQAAETVLRRKFAADRAWLQGQLSLALRAAVDLSFASGPVLDKLGEAVNVSRVAEAHPVMHGRSRLGSRPDVVYCDASVVRADSGAPVRVELRPLVDVAAVLALLASREQAPRLALPPGEALELIRAGGIEIAFHTETST